MMFLIFANIPFTVLVNGKARNCVAYLNHLIQEDLSYLLILFSKIHYDIR